MTNWRSLCEQQRWNALEDWWRTTEDSEARRAFYEWLCGQVPTVERRNGVELIVEHVRPDEAPIEWKHGAQILQEGELEYLVQGDPPEPREELRKQAERYKTLMLDLLQRPEPTEGHPGLSRRCHAQVVLDQFEELAKITACAVASVDPDGLQPEDRNWVKDVIAEAFLAGLDAGAHARAAVGKDIEVHAVRGLNTLNAARRGGANKATPHSERDAIIVKMLESLARGLSKYAAATHAHSAGLGASADANLKVFQRHGPRK